MKNDPRQLCAICGTNEATTADHLPPKGIFPHPRPSNLITVPSCAGCNNNSSALDEAFRLYLALHVGDLDDELTSNYFHEALRTYRHNGRLQREVLGSAEPVEITSETGIYLGQGMKILWNSKAHDTIIERTVRGLYYHHYGEILGPDVHVSPKWFNRPNMDLLNTFSNLTRNVIGNNQLVYLYGRAEDKPSASIWYFVFYGRHWAGAHTGFDNNAKQFVQV